LLGFASLRAPDGACTAGPDVDAIDPWLLGAQDMAKIRRRL